MSALWQGMGIGLAIAAPVGPIGMLCIRRSLAEGAARGLATGLGAAAADALYGLVVAGGLSLGGWLLAHALALKIVGATLLIWLGVAVLRRLLKEQATDTSTPAAEPGSLFSAFAGTLVLTLANPATLLSFVAVLAALGEPGSTRGFELVAGVFLGSALWWCFLVVLVRASRHWLPRWALQAIDGLTGALLLGTGLWVGLHALG